MLSNFYLYSFLGRLASMNGALCPKLLMKGNYISIALSTIKSSNDKMK